MKTNLSGKTAVVTGSTAGVGYAIVRRLALSGANVVINGRKAAAVEEAVSKLREEVEQHVSIQGVAADVGTADGCSLLLEKQPIADIIVNNVGIYEPKDYFGISDSEWMHHFEVNVMSGVRLSRAYLPHMLQRYWGRVLFLSSEWALDIPSNMIHYGLTKSAVLSLALGLAKRVACSGVTVNAILPGPIRAVTQDTPGRNQRELCLTMEETLAAFDITHRPRSHFLHSATPDQVANLVARLASSEADGTTGVLHHVDEDALGINA